MKAALSTLALIAAVAFAQERCDAPYPNVFCNTTEILAFESFDCSPYHIFIARGSDEPYPGRPGNLTREICTRIGKDDCTFENIEYPAKSTAWGKEEWCKSETAGQANGRAQMEGYAQKCPNSKLIMTGLSQGAAVIQTILAGGGGKVFDCEQPDSPALDSATGSKIIAAVTFGSVIRSKSQNFTIGPTKDFDGKRAHTPSQLAALNKYSDRLRDYCHQGDPICAVGSEPVNVYNHLDYFLEHNEEVVSWVAEKAKAESGGQVSQEPHSTSPSTPSPTPTPERSSSALTSSSSILASSTFPTYTNTPSQSISTTSVIAKSAAATPSILVSATRTSTDISETQSAQAGNTGSSNGNGGTGNDATGAASALVVSPLLAAAVAVVLFAI